MFLIDCTQHLHLPIAVAASRSCYPCAVAIADNLVRWCTLCDWQPVACLQRLHFRRRQLPAAIDSKPGLITYGDLYGLAPATVSVPEPEYGAEATKADAYEAYGRVKQDCDFTGACPPEVLKGLTEVENALTAKQYPDAVKKIQAVQTLMVAISR